MKTDKFITDTQILNWGERLQQTGYTVTPKYHHRMTSYPMLVFKQEIGGLFSGNYAITTDPTLDFRFSFSVAKNRVDNFFHIFDRWYSNQVATKVFYQHGDNSEKISDISFKSLTINKSEMDHLVAEKEYVKFTYDLNGRLSAIMMYVTFLEDTIEIFSKLWGYDESGNEHQLTKFSIGEVVSKKDNQSDDYLILDFKAEKGYNDIRVDYEICKMYQVGQIIQYGPAELVSEKNITWNRNSRIDDILED